MSGLPDVEQIRSISKFGISVVTVVFKEGTDIYRARQLVGERLARAAEAIPPGYGTPTLGPIATALGEVFQFQVKATTESGVTPMELRTILDWFIAYQLRRVPGRDRDQLPRRRAEDLPGRARPRQARRRTGCR